MTANEVIVLLNYHTGHDTIEAEWAFDAESRLEKCGFLAATTAGGRAVTVKGTVFVKAVLGLPNPVQTWAMEGAKA